MTVEGTAIVVSVIGGFLVHLYYFGKGMGELRANVKHLTDSFDDFKAQHFIPREEFEARVKSSNEFVTNLLERILTK